MKFAANLNLKEHFTHPVHIARTLLKQERLENLLRIGEEGPPVKEFQALPAVKSWSWVA